MMRTPTTRQGLRANDGHGTVDAILKAWTEAGPHPGWHKMAQAKVRAAMPVLARALDRLANETANPVSARHISVADATQTAEQQTSSRTHPPMRCTHTYDAYQCSREVGHPDAHVATGGTGNIYAVWADDSREGARIHTPDTPDKTR